MTREFTGTDDFVGVTKNVIFKQSNPNAKGDTVLYNITRLQRKNPNQYSFLSYNPAGVIVGDFIWTIEERDFPQLLEQLKNRFGSGLAMVKPNRFRQIC